MKYILITIIFLGLSCKSSKNITTTEVKALGSKFKVEKIETSEVELKVNPTIVLDFEKNTISGNAGCNDYSGKIVVTKGNQIKFENITATKMYCGNMKIEKEFMQKLATVTSFDVKDSQFLLLDEAKKLVLTCAASK
ncbi:MAG: META domain-containing protein [Flavobacteriaceae bacterium]|nr:META domain-containing protein [Flavobacteriaceae bacterium]